MQINKETILKFDRPGPRYTSYPTAPVWKNDLDESVYIDSLRKLGQSKKTLSLYFHIPFCQSMCNFCACNVVIRRKDEKYADEYLKYVFKEMDLVRSYMRNRLKIRQLHWGGGTPNFLSIDQMTRLVNKTKEN